MKPAAHKMRRHGSIAPGGRGVVLRAFDPVARGGRTLFPTRVFEPGEVQRVLKSGHQSRKIGAFVTKGFARGWPIYTLTLEERATCPRSCSEWLACYGNNMQAAERIEHGPAFEEALPREIAALAQAHPGGFMVRLHVLGDFYSVAYVQLWASLLERHDALHLFGFTHHEPGSEIGRAVGLLAADFGWRRAAIRFSGQLHEERASVVLEVGEEPDGAVPCPVGRDGLLRDLRAVLAIDALDRVQETLMDIRVGIGPIGPRAQLRARVAEAFGIEERVLIGKSRKRAVCRARQAAAYCIRTRWPETSYPQIASLLGREDHSTMIHACRTIENLMERDPDLRSRIEGLIRGPLAAQQDAHVALWRAREAERAKIRATAGQRSWSPRFEMAVASSVDAVERVRKVKPKNALSPDDTDALSRRVGSDGLSAAIAAAGGWR